jgi:hypothetical protein
MRIKSIVVVAMALMLGACATSTNLMVDSISHDGSPTGTYVVESGMPGVPATDLYFQEFISHFRQGLAIKGYRPVEGGKTPDLTISFSYGLGDASTERHTYRTPIYDFVGGQTFNVEDVVVNADGSTSRVVRRMHMPVTVQRVGSELHVSTHTTYSAFATLEARKDGSAVWRTSVRMRTDIPDLRPLMRVMAVAAEPYLGTNTGRAIEVKLRQDDPRLGAVSGN